MCIYILWLYISIYSICMYYTCVIFSIGIDQFWVVNDSQGFCPCGPSNTRNSVTSQGLNHRRPKKNIQQKPIEWGIFPSPKFHGFLIWNRFFFCVKKNQFHFRSILLDDFFGCRDRQVVKIGDPLQARMGWRRWHGWRLCAEKPISPGQFLEIGRFHHFKRSSLGWFR